MIYKHIKIIFFISILNQAVLMEMKNNIIDDNNEYEYISDICKTFILLGKNNNFIKYIFLKNCP